MRLSTPKALRRSVVWTLAAIAWLVASLPLGCDSVLAPGSCTCAPVPNRAEPTWSCSAASMDPASRICEVVPGSRAFLNCEQPGVSPAVFSGASTSCSPGFCLSLDGATCEVHCACTP